MGFPPCLPSLDLLQFPLLDPLQHRSHPVSKSDKRAVHTIHAMLMERFPLAFPQDYDAIRPLKVGILADVIERMPGFDPVVLRRVLANHTRRDGYLLALLHHRGDRRYDLDGQPAGLVTEAERLEAARLLEASTRRGQTKAARVRTHQELEEKRRRQREIERRNREAKAARKAEHERIQQEIAARKAALIAQGITPESRAERKRRLAREAAARSPSRPRAEIPAVFEERRPSTPPPPPKPYAGPSEQIPNRAEPAPAKPIPQVEFRKKRRIPPPDET